MTENIVSIKQVNNNHLSKIIDFLEPFANAEPHCFESYTLMFIIPQQILHEDGLGNMHGFIAGSIKSLMSRYRNDLISINQQPIEMNSLGSEAFKSFVKDIDHPNKGIATLTIPFKDVTVSINFLKPDGKKGWMILNVWENERNMLQDCIERYIKHKGITSDILFHTNDVESYFER